VLLRVRGTLAVGLAFVLASCTAGPASVRGQDDDSGPPSVPDQQRRCLPDGEQRERVVITQFFEAYNQGDVDRLRQLADLAELWDPGGAPHHAMLRPELGVWVAAGKGVRDRFEIAELCVYADEGADGTLLRRNDRFADAGLAPLRQSVKVAAERGVLRRLVIYMPQDEEKEQFCNAFGQAIRDVEAMERPATRICG